VLPLRTELVGHPVCPRTAPQLCHTPNSPVLPFCSPTAAACREERDVPKGAQTHPYALHASSVTLLLAPAFLNHQQTLARRPLQSPGTTARAALEHLQTGEAQDTPPAPGSDRPQAQRELPFAALPAERWHSNTSNPSQSCPTAHQKPQSLCTSTEPLLCRHRTSQSPTPA